jgi:hypothetical protein
MDSLTKSVIAMEVTEGKSSPTPSGAGDGNRKEASSSRSRW